MRPVDADRFSDNIQLVMRCWNISPCLSSKESNEAINNLKVALSVLKDEPTLDVIEVARVKEVKNELLRIMDEFISEYRHISQSYVDHFGGKVDAMETARRLVNAALTDLYSCSERRTDARD